MVAPAVPPMFSLAGRVALVTGASRGLGFGMAEGLAEAGATVVLNGRDRGSLEARQAELRGRGYVAHVAPFDVTDEAAARAGVDEVASRHGRLDVLVANAGTHHGAPLAKWTTADWRRVMAANADACFALAQQAAAHMVRAGYGRIIFTGSLTGTLARPGIHGYAASKAALASLARTLAAELGEHGITCNTIAPGYFETELSAKLRQDAAFVERVNARVPVRRWGTPRDLAGLAVFLASGASSYVNGQQIVVDGGMSAVLL